MTQSFSCPASFDDLISGANDPFGLLKDVTPNAPKTKSVNPVEKKFQAIIDFYEAHGRTPSLDAANIQEKLLATSLQAFRSRPDLKTAVASMDVHALLNETASAPQKAESEPQPVFSSFEDLLKNDDSGLLDDIDDSIFNLQHVQSAKPDLRNLPDEIATRKQCEDFFNFEKLFHDTQRDILNRKAKTIRFKNGSIINVGDFFILNGILCFVDAVIQEKIDKHHGSNPRIRVIFDNGMETDILKLSLARALYLDKNGRRVIPETINLEESFAGITHKDKATGCIYILASETKAPELAHLKDQGRLVKIGYSSQRVEERIKNASTDPTYLEAPVRILASIDCYNLNPQKVEHLIHAFLSKQRVNMTLISSKGRAYRPAEWFAVDRDTAVAVAQHIVAGDIMNYRMDNTTGRIKRIAANSH